ncbi:thioredoxin family protein [Flexithrix dorotheae]|uniref:thioredoxin family protein n=1 Tax=Flexithrix dorotheae TaxID=70993 RepID=UPI00036F9D9D|nr:thioredoxin family protein [Flexithrix dorotheae]
MAVELVNDSNFSEIIKNNEKVVVKFFANWCGSCRLFKPKFRRLSENENYADVKFLDVNAEESPEARKLAGVQNLPFFAVFKNGELVDGVPTSQEPAVVELIGKLG